MKASRMARHEQLCKRAAYAIQTALLVLQNENISMCLDVKVDSDCTHGAFYVAVNLCYS